MSADHTNAISGAPKDVPEVQDSDASPVAAPIDQSPQILDTPATNAPSTHEARSSTITDAIWPWVRARAPRRKTLALLVQSVGVALLLWQLQQTERALDQARESNLLLRAAQEQEQRAVQVRAAHDAQLLGAAERSAAAAVEAAEAARRTSDASHLQAQAAVDANALQRAIREDGARITAAVLRTMMELSPPVDEKTGAYGFQMRLFNERPTAAHQVRFRWLALVQPSREGTPPTDDDWSAIGKWSNFGTVFSGETGRSLLVNDRRLPPAFLERYSQGHYLVFHTQLRYCDELQQAHWINRCDYTAKATRSLGLLGCGLEVGTLSAAESQNECGPARQTGPPEWFP